MKVKKLIILLLIVFLLGVPAGAADDITVTVEETSLPAFAEGGVTYVQLSSLLEALGGWETCWDDSARAATSETALFTLNVPVQRDYVLADGYRVELNGENLLCAGRTFVPLRGMASLLGAEVDFEGWDKPVMVREIMAEGWTEEDLYWLSRIISAESQGESLLGQIAVGNVICNRVRSEQFPDTVKDVVFDTKDGVQFEPVSNGSVYDEPEEASVLAARLVLAGVDAAGESLYFFNPALSQGLWVRANRDYCLTIGCHMFFQ